MDEICDKNQQEPEEVGRNLLMYTVHALFEVKIFTKSFCRSNHISLYVEERCDKFYRCDKFRFAKLNSSFPKKGSRSNLDLESRSTVDPPQDDFGFKFNLHI